MTDQKVKDNEPFFTREVYSNLHKLLRNYRYLFSRREFVKKEKSKSLRIRRKLVLSFHVVIQMDGDV